MESYPYHMNHILSKKSHNPWNQILITFNDKIIFPQLTTFNEEDNYYEDNWTNDSTICHTQPTFTFKKSKIYSQSLDVNHSSELPYILTIPELKYSLPYISCLRHNKNKLTRKIIKHRYVKYINSSSQHTDNIFHSFKENIISLKNSLLEVKLRILYTEFNIKMVSEEIHQSRNESVEKINGLFIDINNLIDDLIVTDNPSHLFDLLFNNNTLTLNESYINIHVPLISPQFSECHNNDISYEDSLTLETQKLIDLSIIQEVNLEYVDVNQEITLLNQSDTLIQPIIIDKIEQKQEGYITWSYNKLLYYIGW